MTDMPTVTGAQGLTVRQALQRIINMGGSDDEMLDALRFFLSHGYVTPIVYRSTAHPIGRTLAAEDFRREYQSDPYPSSQRAVTTATRDRYRNASEHRYGPDSSNPVADDRPGNM